MARLYFVLPAVFLGLFAPRPASAQVVVALSGTPAPAGGNYSSFRGSPVFNGSGYPVLNGSGQVAFVANLTGGSSTSGIFAGAPGSLQTVALQGTADPAGGTYQNGIGTTNSFTFDAPVLNGSGQVAFYANLTLSNGAPGQGFFVGAPGSLQTAALGGGVAPQAGGGSYDGFVGTSLKLDDSGQVAFSTAMTAPYSSGIFVGAPGSIQAAALASIHDEYAGFYGPYALNGSGQVAFQSRSSTSTSVNYVLNAGAPGSIQAVATGGGAAPAGGSYSSDGFNGADLNRSGQVAFVAGLTGGSPTQGIFAGPPGSLQAVALQGSAAPGGGTYGDYFGFYTLNRCGQLAFLAALTGSSDGGIFVGTPGSIRAVALDGTAAPAGGFYGGLNGSIDQPFALNDSGQVAFLARLYGGSSTEGIFAGSPGALEAILLVGDVINVASGGGVDDRTVSSIGFFPLSGSQDGNPMSLNDSGLLVYEVTFTDGSSGIFTSQIAPVPEPGTLALVGLAAAGLAGWRRRRSFLAARGP